MSELQGETRDIRRTSEKTLKEDVDYCCSRSLSHDCAKLGR